MDIKKYRSFNERWHKKLIFRLGDDSGFFSEYNNMLIAIMYCMINKIQFVLDSNHANFGRGGWNVFFAPFCKETHCIVFDWINHREKISLTSRKKRILVYIYKLFHPHQIYTYEVFHIMRHLEMDKKIEIPELNIFATPFEILSMIDKMIWQYNPSTQKRIESYMSTISLKDVYVGMHVRQGDKIIEAKLLSPKVYMDKLCQISTGKDVFVLTDDYRMIEYLVEHYPTYNFYTLCEPQETGYDFIKFQRQDMSMQQEALIRLWASMDILSNGNCFIGTISTNPGMTIGLRMPLTQVHYLDCNTWKIW